MYKKLLGSKNLGAVIKSNAYGHGLLEIGDLCQKSSSVDWLCVATMQEAILLRKKGVKKPILVVYFIESDPAQAIAHDIDLMVCDWQTIQALDQVGRAQQKPISIHLKMDSGMSRFGFLSDQIIPIIRQIQAMSGVKLVGIYSHLAQAANDDQTVNQQQQKVFDAVLEAIEQEKISIPYKHLTNSAGTTVLPLDGYNLARVGLGIYGWWPSQFVKDETQRRHPWFELKPVLTLKTRVFQVRTLPENSFVGYDRTYKTTRPCQVAILPIGYYDGYDRRLSSKGITRINSHYAPVIGIIAMTTTIIDVTDIPGVKENDEVVLMGSYEKITPTQLANVIGSFNAREIMTRLNPEIPRIVVE
jgi:alanine racemase